MTRRGFRQSYLGWVRAEVRALLDRGARCGCATTARVCRELLGIEPALYTFAGVEGVEPTNNAAERALRHAVCWRKISGGLGATAFFAAPNGRRQQHPQIAHQNDQQRPGKAEGHDREEASL